MICETAPLDLTGMISVNEQGIPYAPNLYQIQDREVRQLYYRNRAADGIINNTQYLKEAGVIFYLGDPKSPPNQMGLSRAEALAAARKNYDLPDTWEPDDLINSLISRYRKDKVGVAEEALISITKALHNASIAASIISEQLTSKIEAGLQAEDVLSYIDYMNKLNGIINLIPNQIKTLGEAKQAVLLSNEQKKARGGKIVTTSMSASDAASLEAQIALEEERLGLSNKRSTPNFSLRGKSIKPTYESTK